MTGTVNDLQEAAAEKVTVNVNGQSVTLYKGVIVLLLLAIIVLVGWFIWLTNKPTDRAGQTVEATQAKEVAAVPTVAVPVKSVQAYPNPVKKKLNLPQAVQDDDRKVVVAASKVQASDRPHTVTTLIDTETGKAETYVRTDPLPWLAYTSRGAAGVYYGLKNGEQAVRLQVTQNIIQVKAVHIGATASYDRVLTTGRGDTFVGVGAEYRW